MNTWKQRIDYLWQFATETPTGFMCSFCHKQYDGSVERIKWHLAKIEGYDIDICPHVDDEDFAEDVREDYCYPKPLPTRKRARISTDLPSRKRASNSTDDHHAPTLGVHLLATQFVDKQFDNCIQDIWSCLMDDDGDGVFTIGIHGTGGVGKTEVAKCINNKLLQTPNKFHHVFWVTLSPDWTICNGRITVSPPCTVCNLQSRISKAVGVDLSDGDDEIKRAAQLSKGLAEKKKSFLILDDVWDYISLQEVGIPLGVDLCTVLFTTRSLQVCRQLGCRKKIEILCLLPDESYELFKKILGEETTLSREVEDVSRLVVDNCVGLPLAITITVRNMKGVTDIHQWRCALRGDTRKKIDMEIFKRLKLSYDYLKDTTLQHCFLYCTSLVKEGQYYFGKNMLVEYLVDEEIIKKINRRQFELDEAHAKLDFLTDAGLILMNNSHNYVTLNALIWRMSLQIMEENNQQSMIKCDESLKDLPDEESWTEDLVRVSLVGNQIKKMPHDYSPSCCKLSTLLLGKNYHLVVIGNSFFERMSGLKILDLSRTGIQNLPSSIYGLVNLITLILSGCIKLRKFPSVAKLRELKRLDLSFSGVKEVAEAIQMPPKLTYLDLFYTQVKLNPRILAQLSHLQFLRLSCKYSAVTAEELSCLTRLKTLICCIDDVVELNKYIVHLKGFKKLEPPLQFNVKVGPAGALGQGVSVSDFILDEDEHIIPGEVEELIVVILYDCNINNVKNNTTDLLIDTRLISLEFSRIKRVYC